jgi:hypothetical protein
VTLTNTLSSRERQGGEKFYDGEDSFSSEKCQRHHLSDSKKDFYYYFFNIFTNKRQTEMKLFLILITHHEYSILARAQA